MKSTVKRIFLITIFFIVIFLNIFLWYGKEQPFPSPCILLVFNGHYDIEAQNLLASIKKNAPHLLSNILVCVSDKSAKAFAKQNKLRWFSMAPIKDTGNYMSKNMNIMMRRKLEAIVYMLERNIDVLYVDTDVIFIGDPFPAMNAKFDLNIQNDECVPPYKHTNLCAGFMFVRATKESIQLYKNAIKKIVKSDYRSCDQESLNYFIKQQKLSDEKNLTINVLDECKFPNGCRYFDNSDKNCKKQDALIVHNNHIYHDAKWDRFREHGLLFE